MRARRAGLTLERGMSDRTLSVSSFGHILRAPIERVDIADWLSHLQTAEYQRCCPSEHIACGATTTERGEPMWINVELIGDSLLIQHYLGEITDIHHCRMVSTSDVFSPQGRTTWHVVWDLSVEQLDDQNCEYVNQLTATATDEFLAFINESGIPLDRAAAARHAASSAHNEKETPLFAQSIERRALVGTRFPQ
ncbi:MAG: hypothetical protein QOH62_2575 [Solirubrobacteraceae bacterium]|nr:hypothetical protein [Solirubrobacteraceae bacterium]